jgi:V/A-type H+/Na+-transporting ATPase subunit F
MIAVIGEPEFTLGFRLAGIRRVLETDLANDVKSCLKDAQLSVVIIDESSMNQLEEALRKDVVNSLQPVFVAVSEHAAQEELRKLILQSVGVDLMK